MKDALDRIFQFLLDNRYFNKEVQTRHYCNVLSPHHGASEKVIALLYHVANTQSQPSINMLASFYQMIYTNTSKMDSFTGFMSAVDEYHKRPRNYKGLCHAMRDQSGWGDKTAALFTKAIYHIHNGDYPSDLKFWGDIPEGLEQEDMLYLPVDRVIISAFNFISPQNWSFSKINNLLNTHYSNEEVEVWDDLWFWGFITQVGGGTEREMRWNPNKYWMLVGTNKDPQIISSIQKKSSVFLEILEKVRLKP